ncbi:VWD domain-containing protein [Phaeobacter sp.]|uniref:VWD domain-containing protein n=1 Tax=Phaeobacter sp. TaxID=1902409 RepID=UPI0025FD83EC|nr:VWD domain-containing protein [Phaeobacter sp.]
MFKRNSFVFLATIALSSGAFDVHAQSFFPGFFGGTTPAECAQKCKDVKSSCQKDIDRLKSLCKSTGRTLLCDQAKKLGCEASETYCKEMELVSFQDSKCDPPIPPEDDPSPEGGLFGEPHFITFDGLLYDLQSVGDMRLVETDDARFAAHVRLSPFTNNTSVQSAIGLRFDELILNYDTRDEVWRATHFDDAIDIFRFDMGPVAGVLISRPRQGVVRLVHPEIATVTIDIHQSYLNSSIDLRMDQKTTGLLGNNDGNPDNDVQLPEGSDYWAWIHGPYAEAYRLKENSPLLPYRIGETADTFAIDQHPNMPTALKLADLESAAAVCAQKELVHPWHSICVHDVAITDDLRFAEGLYRRELPNVRTLPVLEGGLIAKVSAWIETGSLLQASLSAPETAAAGETIPIDWQGPNGAGDYVSVSRVEDNNASSYINLRYTREEQPLALEMPGEPGRYELRYVFAGKNTKEDDLVLARQVISVEENAVGLRALGSALIGETISIDWQGPDQAGDYISIAALGDKPFKHITREFTRKGSPISLTVPGEPGSYELRYVLAVTNANGDDVVVGQREISVAPTTATLTAPSAIIAGQPFTFDWSGPGFRRDYIAISEVGSKPWKTLDRAAATSSDPMTLSAPKIPGTYELRYVLGVTNANGDDVVLTTQTIEVVE